MRSFALPCTITPKPILGCATRPWKVSLRTYGFQVCEIVMVAPVQLRSCIVGADREFGDFNCGPRTAPATRRHVSARDLPALLYLSANPSTDAQTDGRSRAAVDGGPSCFQIIGA